MLSGGIIQVSFHSVEDRGVDRLSLYVCSDEIGIELKVIHSALKSWI
jgi:hypothetical protein